LIAPEVVASERRVVAFQGELLVPDPLPVGVAQPFECGLAFRSGALHFDLGFERVAKTEVLNYAPFHRLLQSRERANHGKTRRLEVEPRVDDLSLKGA
jgi:hypothetical protein